MHSRGLSEAYLRCHPLRAEDSAEAAALIGRAFATREPMARARGIAQADFSAFVSLCLPPMVDEELSIVARERTSGRMVGAVLAESLSASGPPSWPEGADAARVRAAFAPILALGSTLQAAYTAARPQGAGPVLHVALIGVDAEAVRCGVARLLVEACVERAESRGFRAAIAEATSGTSHRLFRSLGFVDRSMVPYAGFEFQGSLPFTGIRDEGGVVLVERLMEPLGAEGTRDARRGTGR